MNEKWEQIEKVIKAATEKTIPLFFVARQSIMSWSDEDCRIETEKRNQLRTKAMQIKEIKDNGHIRSRQQI